LKNDGVAYYSGHRIYHTCPYPDCSEIVRLGPLCAKHLENIYGVEVKRTTLKDANNTPLRFVGLFATRAFEINEPIVPYLTSQDVFTNKDFTVDGMDPYLIDTTFSSLLYRSAAAVGNTILENRTATNVAGPNKKSSQRGCSASYVDRIVVCSKPIKAGAEIFIFYGKNRREYLNHSIHETKCDDTVSVQATAKRARRTPR
jgi:hypothetical protein